MNGNKLPPKIKKIIIRKTENRIERGVKISVVGLSPVIRCEAFPFHSSAGPSLDRKDKVRAK
jgi:hypothetical protein